MAARLLAFVRLGRPLFLVGGFLLHTLGAAIALYAGAALDLAVLLWGQIAVTAIQIMTHYSNDYFDLEADRANETATWWSGGSRVLAEDMLPPAVARWTATFAALVALGATLWLALGLQTGTLTVPLLLLSLFLALAYSAPPFRLHSRGIGEVTVAVLVPGLTVLVGYYLQAGSLSLLPFLAITPLVGFEFVMMIGVEYPDAEADAAVGKRHLVVRWGPARAALVQGTVLAASVAALPLLVWLGLPRLVAGLVFLTALPLALWYLWQLYRGRWREAQWRPWLAFFGIALIIVPAAAELVGFLALL